MVSLTFNDQHIRSFISKEEVNLFQREVDLHRESIYQRTGKGSEYLGWVDLPDKYENDFLLCLEDDAARIREQSDVVVVIGIGGSYLGTRAVCEALAGSPFGPDQSFKGNHTEIVYAGHHLDEDYHYKLLSWLDTKSYSIIVISKSGTTTEPAIAFRLLREHIEKKYGKEAAIGRIFAVTDASHGALKKLADSEGYTTYTIPDNVGGRYSVLTPVGLLPIAVAGYNIRELLNGAKKMAELLKNENSLAKNPAALYAVLRNILYKKGKTIEILAGYNPSLTYLTEWWKQLFGESEGKDGKGIFPAGVGFTTDLHSMGQYMQDGLKNFFETVITVDKSHNELVIPHDKTNLDGLNYIAGERISHVNRMAAKGTMIAHLDGQVPILQISLPAITESNLGELIYFFEMACAISGYMLDVNPFDQPGVEAYKNNMFALLGKPGK